MAKEKTTSINKQSKIKASQELHRWASATGFVLAQGIHQAEEQRENQIKQYGDGEQNLQIDIMHTHYAKRMFLVKRIKLLVLQVDYQELQKPSREPQGYQRYRTSGRGTIANQWKRKKQCRSTSRSKITTSQELHMWASTTGFVLAQGIHQAEEQRENQNAFFPFSNSFNKQKMLLLSLTKQFLDREANLPPSPSGTNRV